jgi:hypothetical protein
VGGNSKRLRSVVALVHTVLLIAGIPFSSPVENIFWARV